MKKSKLLLLCIGLLCSCSVQKTDLNNDNQSSDNFIKESNSVENKAVFVTEIFCNGRCSNYKNVAKIENITTRVNSMTSVIINTDSFNYHYHIIVNYEKE